MSRKHSAINLATNRAVKSLLWLALMCVGLSAWAAQVAGTVTQLSGPMMVKKPDGKIKVLALKSEVESGDTLVTEKNTYAMVKFIDNSEITLKPSTTFVIEQFAFEAGQPDADRASFSLVKGGLRSLSGLLGKRSKEKFALKTPVATIGIRGTYFIAVLVPLEPTLTPTSPMDMPSAPVPKSTPPQPPGLYTPVLEGSIQVTNPAGTKSFGPDQFGYTASFTQAPVMLATDPGIPFSAPQVFNTSVAPTASSSAAAKPGDVDCVVH